MGTFWRCFGRIWEEFRGGAFFRYVFFRYVFFYTIVEYYFFDVLFIREVLIPSTV